MPVQNLGRRADYSTDSNGKQKRWERSRSIFTIVHVCLNHAILGPMAPRQYFMVSIKHET